MFGRFGQISRIEVKHDSLESYSAIVTFVTVEGMQKAIAASKSADPRYRSLQIMSYPKRTANSLTKLQGNSNQTEAVIDLQKQAIESEGFDQPESIRFFGDGEVATVTIRSRSSLPDEPPEEELVMDSDSDLSDNWAAKVPQRGESTDSRRHSFESSATTPPSPTPTADAWGITINSVSPAASVIVSSDLSQVHSQKTSSSAGFTVPVIYEGLPPEAFSLRHAETASSVGTPGSDSIPD
jgi:hypothetical protein